MRVKTHPGEILKEEFLLPLGMSANALSMALKVPATRISEIIRGRRGVTAETALRLSRYFGNSPQFWLNIQQSYDLSVAETSKWESITQEISPHAA